MAVALRDDSVVRVDVVVLVVVVVVVVVPFLGAAEEPLEVAVLTFGTRGRLSVGVCLDISQRNNTFVLHYSPAWKVQPQ